MTVNSLRAQGNVEDSRWETAVRCIKKYEGWQGPEHHPYVAYGHRIRKGEKFTLVPENFDRCCKIQLTLWQNTFGLLRKNK